MPRATAQFQIDEWDATPAHEADGIGFTRTRAVKTFTGDLAGTSVAELVMAGTPVDGSVAYVGVEHITGRLDGREGGFVLLHDAVHATGQGFASWTILNDSGTGELAGLRGTAHIENEPGGGHTFTLNYTLD